MPSYTLHGANNSTCCQRVLVTAIATGADITLKPVKNYNDIFSPEWTKHHPFNQMPYLVDNETGFELFESRAISKYLAIRAESDLVPLPSDIEAYGKFEQGCSIELTDFDPAASGLAAELIFSKKFGNEPNMARVEKLKGMLRKRLEGYERVLEKQRYMGGERLTLVELFHLPYLALVDRLGVAPELRDGSSPNLARWWREISALPEWAEVIRLGNGRVASTGAGA